MKGARVHYKTIRCKSGGVWVAVRGEGDKPVVRYFSAFCGIRCTTDFIFWSLITKRWIKYPDRIIGESLSSHTPHDYCRSVRAFRRRLRQWRKYLPKGTGFVLSSRFEELEVRGTL